MKINNYIAVVLFILTIMPVNADNVRVSFGETLPPWVLNNGKDGILIDMLNACLAPSGHSITVELYPYARRLIEYKNNRVNAVTDVNPANISEANIQGYFTGALYAYTNYFYSLSKNNYQLTSISDIGQRSLISWQGATTVLGQQYKNMADNNPNYMEIDRQETQVRMLANNRADFIQMDSEIFEFYRRKLTSEGKIDKTLEFDRFNLLGNSPNGILFRSKQVRDDCVSNLKKLTKDDPLQAILILESE